eukprot:CAMPEP_0170422812 /NCGR_PEP_ID=MMETSP0117_2-20130122/36655_1 /TAXON_ID=400756 /ORGANISM="Durinskia baltica, Strain CSIRO CS-38" /LENGTH=292 /DNA_ID=CAMNT_0010681501 /DNA_START=143 /DNA_END=1017 /DNA_ORIENTATION=-
MRRCGKPNSSQRGSATAATQAPGSPSWRCVTETPQGPLIRAAVSGPQAVTKSTPLARSRAAMLSGRGLLTPRCTTTRRDRATPAPQAPREARTGHPPDVWSNGQGLDTIRLVARRKLERTQGLGDSPANLAHGLCSTNARDFIVAGPIHRARSTGTAGNDPSPKPNANPKAQVPPSPRERAFVKARRNVWNASSCSPSGHLALAVAAVAVPTAQVATSAKGSVLATTILLDELACFPAAARMAHGAHAWASGHRHDILLAFRVLCRLIRAAEVALGACGALLANFAIAHLCA